MKPIADEPSTQPAAATGPRIRVASALLFLAAFGLHNIEECLTGMPQWMARHAPQEIAGFYQAEPFMLAAIILWIAYFLVISITLKSQSRLWHMTYDIATAAIVANAILHVGARLVFQSDMPGIWTASFLILPMGFINMLMAIKLDQQRIWKMVSLLAFGGLAQIPLAALALALANLFA